MGPAFAESEHRERLSRARQALAQAGLDGCVCVAPEHLYYLGGYDAHTHFSAQALVFSVSEEESPTLVIRDADIACATETSWVRDVCTYHHGSEEPAELVAAVAREKGLDRGALGVELGAYALPAAYFQRLVKSFRSGTRFEDVTGIVGALRVVKSPAELDYVRQAMHHSEAGLETLLAAIEPGRTEIALASEAEQALRASGSDYPAMPTWLHSGPRTALSHAMPTERIVRSGEPVQFSFAGVERRYHVSVYHSVHLGEPGQRFRDFYAAAEEAQSATLEAITVGAPVCDAANAARRVVNRLGFSRNAKIRWGYGVGIGYPPAWLEPLDIIEESPDVFRAGMVFCVHAHLTAPEEELGVIVGGDYLLSDEGLDPLDKTGGAPERRGLMVI